MDTISGARVRQELMRLLAEERPETALLRCQALGVLAAVHPALRFDGRLAAAFRAARRREEASLGSELYLSLLGTLLSPDEAAAVAHRLSFSTRERRVLEGAAALGCVIADLAQPRLRPSQAVALLEAYPEASLWAWALAAPLPAVRRRLRLYLERWRYVKPALDGRALEGLGVTRGPLVGEAMRMLQTARLDGRVHSREEEVAAVRRLVTTRGGPS